MKNADVFGDTGVGAPRYNKYTVHPPLLQIHWIHISHLGYQQATAGALERALASRFARPGAIHSEGEAPLARRFAGSALSDLSRVRVALASQLS